MSYLIKKEKYADKVNVISLSYMHGDELKIYAQNNIDILFNFGIAALDMASQNLPVVIPVFESKDALKSEQVNS